ncbi:MAG: YcbK family protein [Gemmatimonadaceae bacterium]
MQQAPGRARPVGRAVAFLGVTAAAVVAASGAASDHLIFAAPAVVTIPADTAADSARADGSSLLAALGIDTLFGLSGKLHARFLAPSPAPSVGSPGTSVFARLFGDSAASIPGIYSVPDDITGRSFAYITLVPFDSKNNGRIGDYRIGYWPGERRAPRSEAYGNPDGFIVVTPENQDTRISDHFRLRDFLTHDQRAVWPKYLVLRAELIDKLELVIDELGARDVLVERMVVMSGFRTPQYNANGGQTAGRASLSRHMYGDAADIFVDNNGDGRMDDLNGDGRVNTRDAKVLHDAAERVEKVYPALVGGIGVYRANSSHGPFAHIDVRGSRARWGAL